MESPDASKEEAQVGQARIFNRFISESKVEFGGLFEECEAVDRHQNKTDDAYHAKACGHGGRLWS